MDFKDILNSSMMELRKGNKEKAYQILLDNRDSYVKEVSLYYFTIYLTCSLEKIEDALFYLREAIVTLDMWFNTEFLDSDPTLDIIRDLDEYKELYNICKQRQTDFRFTGEKRINIYEPQSKTRKLFFMLPGSFQPIEEVKSTFNEATIDDYIIAIPQPRELHSYMSYTWGDIDFGVKTILEYYNEIVNNKRIETNDVILSSFAGGGKIVLEALLDDKIPAKKAIFFAPELPDLSTRESKIKTLKKRGVKLYIICGEKDLHYLPISNRFDDLLSKHNIEHKYIVVKELGHTFPANTNEILEQAFTFFKQSK